MAKKDKSKKDVPPLRSLLDIRKKEGMMAVLIRNQDAFDAVSTQLQVNDVRYISEPLGLVWKTVLDFHAEYRELPERGQLEDEIHDRLTANPALLSDDELPDVDDFIDYAFDTESHGVDISKSDKHVRVALKTCKLFLQELMVADAQEALQSGSMLPIDIPDVLEKQRAAFAAVESITAPPTSKIFDVGWDEEPSVVLKRYGLDVLDNMLGGGPAGGETLLFMAPYGICKTTLGTIVTYNKAEQAAKASAGNAPWLEVATIVSTEMPKRELRERLLVYGAKIPRKRIRAYLSKQLEWRDFSSASKPAATPETQYEQYLFPTGSSFPEGFKCEQERFETAMKIANKHILFLDFSATDAQLKAVGGGGMRELASSVSAELRRHPNHKPNSLVVDHISDRMLDSGLYRKEDLTTILQNMPRQARDWVGLKYDIPVLLFHQFSGAANAKTSPGARLHHSDAAGCKSIAMYCDFAFVCGHPEVDEEQIQIARWDCTKHRREPPSAHVLVRIDGTYHRLVDATHTHKMEGNRIVPIDTAVRQVGHDRNARSVQQLAPVKDAQARKGVNID